MILHFAAAVLACSFVSTTAAVAAPAITPAASTTAAKVQQVKFTLRNDTASDLKLAAGAWQVTVAAGKSVNVKLPVGEKIVAATECGRYAQGDLVSTVADVMNGNTLAIR